MHHPGVDDLVNRHGRMVFTTAWRILGESTSAEDVLQTVFLKVLHLKDRQHAEIREWGAWLRVLATRCALDELRSRRHHVLDSEELPDSFLASPDDDPHQLLHEKQNAARMRRLLRELPDKDARIFALRFFEELSYEEIAAALNLSVNQVGVSLHRSRKRLSVLLEKREAAGAVGFFGRFWNKEKRHGLS